MSKFKFIECLKAFFFIQSIYVFFIAMGSFLFWKLPTTEVIFSMTRGSIFVGVMFTIIYFVLSSKDQAFYKWKGQDE